MVLKMADPCPHDISDQDVAAQVDGLCPLCLKVDLDRLRLNFKDMKRTKQRTELRLKIAINALKLIADENSRWSEKHQIAIAALARVTGDVGGSKE